MQKINGVEVGYTQNGNTYVKSNSGKKTGTVIGLGGSIFGGGLVAKKFAENNLLNITFVPAKSTSADKNAVCEVIQKGGVKDLVKLVKQFVKDPKILQPEKLFTGKFLEKWLVFGPKLKHSKLGPLIDILLKSKLGRIGLVASAILLPILAVSLAGRALGALYDMIANRGAKHQADLHHVLLK